METQLLFVCQVGENVKMKVCLMHMWKWKFAIYAALYFDHAAPKSLHFSMKYMKVSYNFFNVKLFYNLLTSAPNVFCVLLYMGQLHMLIMHSDSKLGT